jgi:glutamine amidotransferase
MIGIVDYGMGNLRSVQKAFERIGYEPGIVDRPGEIEETDFLVVPGVGAFDRAVTNLRENDLWTPIQDHLEKSKPYLGLCLGLQLLFERSDEGEKAGFGRYEGAVRRFEDVRHVPHMGWNDVRWTGPGSRFEPDETDSPCYYFVHSYYVDPADESIVAGETDYGSAFCAAIRDGRTAGVQFHPEKSQYAGLNLLETITEEFYTASEPST